MPTFVMKGKRLPILANGEINLPQNPGEYCGPIMGYIGKLLAIFFLKPNSRDADATPIARSVQHVAIPPHKYQENPDGTLTITPSISDTRGDGSGGSDGWHGYLTNGDWYLA